jgi:hypothetical protein
MEDVKIDVLGTEYAIHYRNEHDDPLLDGKCRDGYTDNSAHEIVICNQKEDCELQNYENYRKSVLRHEIIHAFLYESGLDSSSYSYGAWAINEEMVDWFAIQSPKIFRVFAELKLL